MQEKNPFISNYYGEDADAELIASAGDTGFLIRALQKAAIDCVGKGDINGISRIIKAYVKVGANSEVTVPLRSRKNRFIALCALICERALLAGLEDSTVNDLWENYSQRCEDCTSAEQVNALNIKLLLEFTELVKTSSEKKLSASVTGVREFVESHLFERISVSEVAESLGMNASYLNSRYKEQTGECITDYIQKQKINEAKKLLSFSENPISEIWTALGFYDQSHFNKIFKKQTGMTPKQFRINIHN